MALVTEILPLSARRCLVKLEDGTFFPLYKGELARYGIREEEPLSGQARSELFEKLLPARARQRAMHLLERRDLTESRLRKKLEESGYPEDLVSQAVDYVRGFHYIDDVRYAFQYMDYRKDSHSRLQLRMELKERGVSEEDISAAMEEVDWPSEKDQVLAWLEKKHFDPEQSDRKETEKTIRFLARKGFSMSVILSCVQKEF